MGCDKDNRDLKVIGDQLALELDAVHSRHADVEQQAVRPSRLARTQVLFG
jgi:hypothetical protein